MIPQALLLARKELLSFLVSPFAYAIAGFFLLVNGIYFFLFAGIPGGDFELVTQLFFTFLHFWLLALVVPPLVTMRLLADEFRLGTIETLMTAPSSDSGVVLGKWLAAYAYTALLWIPTVLFFVIASAFGASFDWGVVAAGYLAALLVYALFLSVGVFTSALTENPILSAFVAFLIEMGFFFLMFLRLLTKWPVAEQISDRYSIYTMLERSFLAGIIDTSHLVFFASATWLFLFLATRSLEFRRWR